MKKKKKSTQDSKQPKVTKPVEKLPVVSEKIQVQHLDTRSLKGAVAQLHKMGLVKAMPPPASSDAEMGAVLNRAIASISTPETLAQLEQIDPTRVVSVLKGNCIGLFIDLRTAACQACPDAGTCLQSYLKNAKNGFADFKSVIATIKADDVASKVPDAAIEQHNQATEKDNEMKSKATKKPVNPMLVYDKGAHVFWSYSKNTQPKKPQSVYALVDRLLKDNPATLGDFFALCIDQGFRLDENVFMKEIVSQMVAEGYCKLEVHLNSAERLALTQAGFKLKS